MRKLFGTDGVRGRYGYELTDKLAYLLGKYGTTVLAKEKDHPKIIIGRDTRASGKPLEDALIAGINAAGGRAVSLGIIPTPAVALLTKNLKADAGIVISASHNTSEYNGIKFFNRLGFKLPDEKEKEIETLIFSHPQHDDTPSEKTAFQSLENAADLYIDALLLYLKPDLTGKKIVLDCANGALYAIAPRVFKSLGATVITLGCQPDGNNINEQCGSTHLDGLKKEVLVQQADFGLAFDGDADRCLAIDNKGELVDGDKILYLLGKELKKENKLSKNTLVITVMSNLGLHKAAKEEGMTLITTQVGDRYVLENMLENGYTLGGEQSGHIIYLDYNTTGDGLMTGLLFSNLIVDAQKSVYELASQMKVFPQVLKNAKVSNENKNNYMDHPEISRKIKEIEDHFHGNGRVLIRPSGTEPLVRVMIEGEDQGELDHIATSLAIFIEERLNVPSGM